MVWTRSPVYFYQRNDIYYFSRAVPKDLQARFNKRRVEVSLKTKSVDKARSLSMTLSERLERHWDSLRLEQIHSRELGLSLINADLRPNDEKTSLSVAVAMLMRLGSWPSKLGSDKHAPQAWGIGGV